MPLDNTDVAALSTLTGLAPLQANDIVAVYRPGSPTPLQTARVSDIGAALGGAMTIESQGETTTSAPISLNFTSGLTVVDDGHGNETIATCFASVKDFGATGDGTTNDVAAFTAAAAAGVTIFVPPGTYKLSSSVTFPHQVVFLAGAVIAPASATITTFNGGIVAPPAQIFSLTGSAAIAFSPATQLVAFAEWWGAVTYGAGAYPVSSPTFSDVAIQAAVNCGAASVQLMGADYYIAAAINITNSYTKLRGVSASLNAFTGATRLVIKSATIDGIVIGASSKPSGSGTTNWIDHVTVENLTVIRSVKPTSLSGNAAGSPSGVRLRWALQCTIRGVTSQDHSNGFYITGTASCVLRDCWAERSLTDNGSGFDYWHGISQDNSASSGFNSGNASLYHLQNAVHNGAGSFSDGTWGLYIYGGFSDTYLDGFETALTAIGVEADGSGTSGTTAVSENLQIVNSVFDQASAHGILIYNCDAASQVRIANCYIGAAASGECLTFNAFKGAATVTGCQLWGQGAGVTGLHLTGNSLSVSSAGNIITDCAAPVIFDDAGMCRCQDVINQAAISVTTASVWLTNSTFRCMVNPQVNGVSSGQCKIGVKVDTGVGYCFVDPSGMNAGALTSGSSANKIVYNGTQITTIGAFGTTNLASGIMG